MPLELLAHTVSHLKALIRYKLEPKGQGHGSTFSICHALLKNAILLHIEATVWIFFGPSVYGAKRQRITPRNLGLGQWYWVIILIRLGELSGLFITCNPS